MHYFSFCVYGTHSKYLEGLIENINIIKKLNEDNNIFGVIVAIGNDITNEYIQRLIDLFPTIYIHTINESNTLVTLQRYFAIDLENIDIDDNSCVFFRDSDSRIHLRDQWCINKFISETNYDVNIIRDHYWHKVRIPGGMWGIRPKRFFNLTNGKLMKEYYKDCIDNGKYINAYYGIDQDFLASSIYPVIQNLNILTISNIVGFENETVLRIECDNNYNTDFVGNVIYLENNIWIPEFRYWSFPLITHMIFLVNQKQWEIIRYMHHQDGFKALYAKLSSYEKYNILIIVLNAMQMCGALQEYREVLTHFGTDTHVDENIINISNNFIKIWAKKENKKIIATTDMLRKQNEDEIVIYYGNFLHDVECLPIKQSIYRHPIYFNSLQHDSVEYNKAWEKFSYFYIHNLEDRNDRYIEILAELCKLQIPLDRVYHYVAKKTEYTDNKTINSYLGASYNHRDTALHFKENVNSSRPFAVVFEDDFSVCSNVEPRINDVAEFVNRVETNNLIFDLCFIGCSKYHEIREYDDLLNISYQKCTTTSGYILHSNTVDRILNCFEEGCTQMINTGDYHRYVCDRYWHENIQRDGKMFILRRKLGYQRPNYSSIEKIYKCHFD